MTGDAFWHTQDSAFGQPGAVAWQLWYRDRIYSWRNYVYSLAWLPTCNLDVG
jgi:hypothetical protein